MDFETAASMSGSRFVILKGFQPFGTGVGELMLDTHTQEFAIWKWRRL